MIIVVRTTFLTYALILSLLSIIEFAHELSDAHETGQVQSKHETGGVLLSVTIDVCSALYFTNYMHTTKMNEQ